MLSLYGFEEEDLVSAYNEEDREKCVKILLLSSQAGKAADIVCDYLKESGWLTVPLLNKENAIDMYIKDAYHALEDEIVRIVEEATSV